MSNNATTEASVEEVGLAQIVLEDARRANPGVSDANLPLVALEKSRDLHLRMKEKYPTMYGLKMELGHRKRLLEGALETPENVDAALGFVAVEFNNVLSEINQTGGAVTYQEATQRAVERTVRGKPYLKQRSETHPGIPDDLTGAHLATVGLFLENEKLRKELQNT
jgi:hypothetical protein